MKQHTHGGDVYHLENCLDFSANCNPLGIPEAVKQAMMESFSLLENYPQVGYEPLKIAIADYEQCKKEYVICGNGAAEIIYTLCHAAKPKKALLPAPTFAEYEVALDSVDCEIAYYNLSEAKGFVIDNEICSQIHPDTDIVFLCNPNNPTGILTEKNVLMEIAETCAKYNTLLIVDECFLDFVKDADRYTLKAELENFSNLFLLKAFTKRYAMAGVRLGYGLCANQELLEKMNYCVQPWNISVMAQKAGIAALKEREYVARAREIIFCEQEYLISALSRLGFAVSPSTSNYIFFRGPMGLCEKSRAEGILIRDCSNYTGLTAGWYRVAVRLHHENERLIDVLAQITGESDAIE